MFTSASGWGTSFTGKDFIFFNPAKDTRACLNTALKKEMAYSIEIIFFFEIFLLFLTIYRFANGNV